MNLWPAAWDGLQSLIRSVWPDVPVERIYRVRHVANADYKTLQTPYVVVEVPPTSISEEWSGIGRAAYVPKISFFRVDALHEGQDDDAPLEANLSAMEETLRHTPFTWGQVIETGMPDVAQNNRINGELADKKVAHIGGAITADILLMKP